MYHFFFSNLICYKSFSKLYGKYTTMAKMGIPALKKCKKLPRKSPNGYRLPDPLPEGLVLTDVVKQQWIIGKSIGRGGFGEIYLASDDTRRIPTLDSKYVVKFEPHENGPLFCEKNFYMRVAKAKQIKKWKRKKNLRFLGMPKYIIFGSHEHNQVKYRFIVMERFGLDLQKLLNQNNNVFPMKTVYTVGKIILDTLEYIHSHGYIHADIKASNLLTGFGPEKENEVYLIDFGLVCCYIVNGQHIKFKKDCKSAHDGTIEFTSRDAHIGAFSRRGDLEVLGYNMLQWLCGRLPWEDNLKDPESVSRQKSMYMSNIYSLIKSCYGKKSPTCGIVEYFTYVAGLTFEEAPDYKYCKEILSAAIKGSGFEDDGVLVYTSTAIKTASLKGVERSAERGSLSFSPPAKSKRRLPPSESTGNSQLPKRKLRRVASATESMQSSGTDHPTPSSSFGVLENPTPAMLLVKQNMECQMQASQLKKRKNKNMAKIKIPALKKGEKLPRLSPNGNRLPDPLPKGLVLTDDMKQQWRIGKSIGLGGFVEIYLSSDDARRIPTLASKYVVKIEPNTNGPLFSEMHFYHRVAKAEQIEEWKSQKNLRFLGLPKFIGSGSLEHKQVKYRFMVMERFGLDLQKLLNQNNKVFPLKTVYTLGKIILDILEYIHSHGYIHADIKASNLLTGFGPEKENEVYLIDFGLVCCYIVNGQHKKLKEHRRKAHDGTIEFTSRDAHIGAHSRRGDLEVLGYNMLQWLFGRLPWEDNLKDPEFVSDQKYMFKTNISLLIESYYGKKSPTCGIVEYFTYVAGLTFEEAPDYKYCKEILSAAIKGSGFEDDGVLVYTSTGIQTASQK